MAEIGQNNPLSEFLGLPLSFVHLHCHSQYSLLEATCRFKQLAGQAAEWGMPAVSLTDNGNMYGAVEFYFACKSAGVKPIVGLDVYLAPHGRLVKGEHRDNVPKPNTRMVLLAQNYEGYQNLCQISSIGFHEGFYYKPRVDYEILEKYSDNVIALSGNLRGEIPFHFLDQGKDVALEKVQALKKIYGDRLYLEMCRTGVREWKEVNEFLLEVAESEKLKYVATNDVHYFNRDEKLAQEVLVCIGTNKTLQDDSRFQLGSDQFYFKSPEEMRQTFSDLPEACDQTLEIADRCDIKFTLEDEKGQPIYHLPTYPTQEGRSLKEEIRVVSEQGLQERFDQAKAIGEDIPEDKKTVYYERLDYELGVIDGMGFNGYFLIVQDFIRWAKENGIPVGPGRGSGAGSLVAYCLSITDLDPIPNALIFERFLNPERVSMPDFDIDFCQDRRQEVIEYVTQKYSPPSVSQIITYGKLQAKAAIRDVGRVLGMLYAEVDVISKLMPDKLGLTLNEALEMEPRLTEAMEMNPQYNTLMELAQKVEGLVRHAGIHAAGVIIADGELVQHAPLSKGANGEQVVQDDMKHAEKIGLIKFDFLGLKTLTHINNALKLIEKNRGKKITEQDISMNDKGIYEVFCSGDTNGVFQFEGDGITEATKKIKPSCFGDIVAITSLYRPGPMEMIPEYTRRKHGESEITYIFPELEEILSETYGIIIYQEHVQLIAAKIASYSLGEADMLRRAMGKKIAEEMAKQKTRFLEGAAKNGYDKNKAAELFGLMEEFAKYGFNKSHAAAYCVVSGQTAWLKRYYPVEFYAALLSTEMGDTDKVVKYIKDAGKKDIVVRPPHIDYSEHKFTVEGDEIFFGLGAIKGVGESAIEAIIEAREKMPDKKFGSLEKFFEEIDLRRVNKKVIECLIKAGAFEGYGDNRATLLAGYPKFMDRADANRKDKEVGQASLFDLGETNEQKVQLEERPPWPRSVRLGYEKEVIGFYLSDHPLKGLEGLIRAFASADIANLGPYAERIIQAKKENSEGKKPAKKDWRERQNEGKAPVVVAGLVAEFREIITKKGTRMAFAQLEDLSGSIELVVFPKAYQEYETILKEDDPILVHGLFENDEGQMKILVDKVEKLEDSLKKAKKMSIRLDSTMQNQLGDLSAILDRYPGTTKVKFVIELPEMGKVITLKRGETEGVGASNELFEGIHSLFGRMDFVELETGASVGAQ